MKDDDIVTRIKNKDVRGLEELICRYGTVYTDETFISVNGKPYPYIRGADGGRICCFDRPIAVSEVEKVVLYLKFYDEGSDERIEEYILYGE